MFRTRKPNNGFSRQKSYTDTVRSGCFRSKKVIKAKKKSVYRKHTKGKEIELWMFHL